MASVPPHPISPGCSVQQGNPSPGSLRTCRIGEFRTVAWNERMNYRNHQRCNAPPGQAFACIDSLGREGVSPAGDSTRIPASPRSTQASRYCINRAATALLPYVLRLHVRCLLMPPWDALTLCAPVQPSWSLSTWGRGPVFCSTVWRHDVF